MRRQMVLTAVVFLATRITFADDIIKLNMDAHAASLRLTVADDVDVKAEGNASLRITAPGPGLTLPLATFGTVNVTNAAICAKARIKTDMKGDVHLFMTFLRRGGAGFTDGRNNLVKDRSDWRIHSTGAVTIPGDAVLHDITLNLEIRGEGTVWIDDVSLSTASLEAGAAEPSVRGDGKPAPQPLEFGEAQSCE